MEHVSITADDVRFLSALAQADAASRGAAGMAGRQVLDADSAQAAVGIASADAVASMNTQVDYVEIATGRSRTVMLVHPANADASAGRVSVLSPVGRSLLGCCPGDHAEVQLPGGQPMRLLVADVRCEARDA